MIQSMYSLSRASPDMLIMAGVPAMFVDECTRSGVFVSESEDKVVLASQTPLPAPPGRNKSSNKLNAIETGLHVQASQGTPYRRDTPHSQRTENWSLEEMMVLLNAKKLEDTVCITNGVSKKIRSAKDKWEAISAHCFEKSVHKTPHQCWLKWVKLNKCFRKIYRYEKDFQSTPESFWNLSTKARREKRVPTSFHQDIYNAMVEKFGYGRETNREGPLVDLPGLQEDHLNGVDALQPASEMQDDLLSMSSQHLNFGVKRPKLDPKPRASRKERTHNTKQLIERYENLEYNKLKAEKQRITIDEKHSASLCSSIAEIASAIRSIAEVLHSRR
ncbi:hypothetical protein O6H91_03G012900 [Diphasiastrum complanatum]|uniref:Uncharacterized protein n=1 Tax=Diphasiastrum complanatum TaxID=34168 RepID=A0ACC2E453_DIPCM|nr:hypothetical protein O6H91_03G012900 [Diphasiastrum complanatum]